MLLPFVSLRRWRILKYLDCTIAGKVLYNIGIFNKSTIAIIKIKPFDDSIHIILGTSKQKVTLVQITISVEVKIEE